MLKNNHTDANKGKIIGYLYLEVVFGFCKTFKKVTKNLVFHIMFKTKDLQTLADDIKVTNNNLYLYVPNLIPNVETQVKFNEATQNNFNITCDEYYTERRVISDMIAEVDIESSQKVNSPKYLIGAHQTRVRADTANKYNKIAIFDHLSPQKNYVEIDGIRYPRDGVLVNYEQNDYIEQYKDIKLFFKEYVGEEVMTAFISYPDMKTKYSVEILDLRPQHDHITHKKFKYSKNVVLILRMLDFL